MRPGHIATLFLAHLGCSGTLVAGVGLRWSRVAKRFPSLEKCEAAYGQLYDQCMPKSAKQSRITETPKYDPDAEVPRPPPKSINDGEVGAPDEVAARPVYHPPASRTGAPSDQDGWDYRQHGEDWAQKFNQCAGPKQSPVDVAKYVDMQGQTKYLLWFDYYLDPDLKVETEANLVNDGHGIRYDVHGNRVDLGFVKIGTQAYEAAEYQFHAPSEHTVDGAVFPLEVQIYNRQTEGQGVVAIAIFFKEGNSNEFLRSILDATRGHGPVWNTQSGKGTAVLSGNFSGAFNLENLIPKADVSKEAQFYNYEGSLTQPPCTVGVDWWVLKDPITATREEIKFIRKAIFSSESTRHGNARETQPIGDRRIFVGLGGFQHAVKYHKMPQWQHLDESKKERGYSSQDLPWGSHWGTEGVEST